MQASSTPSPQERSLFVSLLFLGPRRVRQRPLPFFRVRLRLENLEARTLMSVDLGITTEGITPAGWIPPDTIGAAGPDYFVEAINLQVAYYRKVDGVKVFQQDLGTFFRPLGGVLNLSDPVVTYDEFTGQFVVGAIDYNLGTQARFDVAISNDSDPNDGWYEARYNMYDGIGSGTLNDYPKMGYNADAYVISFNMFPSGGPFHVDTLSIDKNTLAGYANIVPGGSNNGTLVPAVMHDANPGDPEWLIEDWTYTSVEVCEMSNVLSNSPNYQFFNVPVPQYAEPPNATQLGGGGTIPVNQLSTRFYNAAERYGQLVAAHTIGAGTVDHARWYQLDISQGYPVLVQVGDVDPGPGINTYFPTIEINANADLGMTYIESSPSEYMSMYVTGQANGDPLNTMQPGAVTHPGIGRYTLSRVGDYSGISVDPNDLTTFWAANEYRGTDPSFNTGIASFTVSPSGDSAFSLRQDSVAVGANRPALLSIATTGGTAIPASIRAGVAPDTNPAGTLFATTPLTPESAVAAPLVKSLPTTDSMQEDWRWEGGLSE
jgi:hypothetical protein